MNTQPHIKSQLIDIDLSYRKLYDVLNKGDYVCISRFGMTALGQINKVKEEGDNMIVVCQNRFNGYGVSDRLGYDYSWIISNKHHTPETLEIEMLIKFQPNG